MVDLTLVKITNEHFAREMENMKASETRKAEESLYKTINVCSTIGLFACAILLIVTLYH